MADIIRAAGQRLIDRHPAWLTWLHVKVLVAVAQENGDEFGAGERRGAEAPEAFTRAIGIGIGDGHAPTIGAVLRFRGAVRRLEGPRYAVVVGQVR